MNNSIELPSASDSGAPEIKEAPADRIFRLLSEAVARMSPGFKLPSEREIAQAHDVGRQTARQALNRLALVGSVERRVGSGTYVKESAKGTVEDVLPAPVYAGLIDILQARRALDPVIADLVTQHATQRDVREFEALLDNMRSAKDQFDYKKHGYQFNMALAVATRNPLLEACYRLLMRSREDLGWSRIPTISQETGMREARISKCAQMVDAIRNRDRFTAVNLAIENANWLLQNALGPRFDAGAITQLPEDASAHRNLGQVIARK